MAIDLAGEAKKRGIEYFLISFVDLYGVMRAKLVPASAIAGMARDGAGFAAPEFVYTKAGQSRESLVAHRADAFRKLVAGCFAKG